MASPCISLPLSSYPRRNSKGRIEERKGEGPSDQVSLIPPDVSSFSCSSSECATMKPYSPSSSSLSLTMTPYLKSLIFILFILLFCLGVTLPFVTVPLVKLKQEATFAIKNRFARSPFFPPAVTSYRPPIRKNNRSVPIPVLSVPVRQSRNTYLNPMVEQRRIITQSPLNKSQEETEKTPHQENFTTHGKGSHFPPFISSQVYIPKSSNEFVDELTSIHLIPSSPSLSSSAQPQNDQHSKSERKTDQKKEDYNFDGHSDRVHISRIRTDDRKPYSSHPNFHPPNVVKSSETEDNKEEKFATYDQVLQKMGKSDDDFRDILHKKGIDFKAFTDFLDAGATEKEIENLLNVSYFPRDGDSSTFTSNVNYQPTTVFKEEPRRINHLTDIPFTEIVHDLSDNYDKSIDMNFKRVKIPYKGAENTDKRYKNKYKDKHFKKRGPWKIKKKDKFNKEGNNEFSYRGKPKNSKSKYGQSIKHIFYHDMMLQSNASTMLPPKDSPMATNFMPPKRKGKKDHDITSTVFNEKINIEQENKSDLSSSDTTKIQNDKDLQSNDEILSNAKLESSYRKKAKTPTYKGRYIHMRNESIREDQIGYQQSKLRLVFPMKGLLIVCAILGAIAFVTTLILIAYAAVRCNRKKPQCYGVQLKKGDSETTVLSASV